jgi:hypothetical protein
LPTAADEQEAVERLLAESQARGRWLLIYDNAEQPGLWRGCGRRSGLGMCW